MSQLNFAALRDHRVRSGTLTIWPLGQASFLVKSPGGKIVALDPYLSNSCKSLGAGAGFDMNRLFPPPILPAELVGIDLYLLTHTHQDHLDPETLKPYRDAGGKGPYLAPAETTIKLQELGVPADEIEMTWPNKVKTLGDLSIRTTFAIPLGGDDLTHVGYLIKSEDGPTIYFTGDTDYNELLWIAVAPHKPDAMVAVINGAFRNLGPRQAARLAERINPRLVIPCHHDLFPDNLQPPQMLKTNLNILGLADKYCEIPVGRPFSIMKG